MVQQDGVVYDKTGMVVAVDNERAQAQPVENGTDRASRSIAVEASDQTSPLPQDTGEMIGSTGIYQSFASLTLRARLRISPGDYG
jgi:hypothetical protein